MGLEFVRIESELSRNMDIVCGLGHASLSNVVSMDGIIRSVRS